MARGRGNEISGAASLIQTINLVSLSQLTKGWYRDSRNNIYSKSFLTSVILSMQHCVVLPDIQEAQKPSLFIRLNQIALPQAIQYKKSSPSHKRSKSEKKTKTKKVHNDRTVLLIHPAHHQRRRIQRLRNAFPALAAPQALTHFDKSRDSGWRECCAARR